MKTLKSLGMCVVVGLLITSLCSCGSNVGTTENNKLTVGGTWTGTYVVNTTRTETGAMTMVLVQNENTINGVMYVDREPDQLSISGTVADNELNFDASKDGKSIHFSASVSSDTLNGTFVGNVDGPVSGTFQLNKS